MLIRLHFLSLFHNDDFWNLLTVETNRYTHQFLASHEIKPHSRFHQWYKADDHPDCVVSTRGSFDILRRKTGSEVLMKDFSLLLERLCHYGAHRIFISGPIPTMGKGIELFSRLLGLNTWLSNACITHGIKFIDNFNIFWNCTERFRPDGVHPNRTGCRLLGAHLRHAVGTANPNMTVQIRVKDTASRQTTSPSPDPLLHITQGLQRMSLSQPGLQRPPSTKKHMAFPPLSWQSRAQGDVQDVQGAAAEFKTKITCHDAFRVPAIVVLLLTAVLRTSWDPVGFL